MNHLFKIQLSLIQKRLYILLEKHGRMTRRELREKYKEEHKKTLPRTTAYDNLKILKNLKMIDKCRENDGTRGQPPIYWYIINSK